MRKRPKKIYTDKHEGWNLTERLHRRTLTVEHDRNMDEYDRKYIFKNHQDDEHEQVTLTEIM